MSQTWKCKKIENRAADILKVCGVHKIYVRDKQWLCPAERCDNEFSSIVLLKTHFITEHNKKPFICDWTNCNWAFPTKTKLEIHKNSHSGTKPFQCNVQECGKLFSTRSNLKHHFKQNHETLKFACSVDNCTAAFANQKSLDAHFAKHSDVCLKYRCAAKDCGSEFSSQHALNFHARRHNYREDEVLCRQCGKIFSAPSRLKTHIRSHSRENVFHCPEPGCGWSFPVISRLNRHMDSHRSNRKFLCSHHDCGKAFLRREHLRDHEVVHTRPKKETKARDWRSKSKAITSSDGGATIEEHIEVTPSSQTVVENTRALGSARTSLTYSDIVVEKETRNVAAKLESHGRPAVELSIGLTDSNVGSLSESMHPTSDILSSSAIFSDPVHLMGQDVLLSQVLHLDSSTPLSHLEPSTINLRDLE